MNDFALNDPNVDIISNHYYTNAENNHPEQVRKDLEAIGGKKVYLVGEFGLLDQKTLTLSCRPLCIPRSMARRRRGLYLGLPWSSP